MAENLEQSNVPVPPPPTVEAMEYFEMIRVGNPRMSEPTGNRYYKPGQGMVLPKGWIYRQPAIGNYRLPWYASPKVQLTVVSLICFLCPGMFNALSSLGGAGQTDPTLADVMNTVLYSTLAIFGFFSGTIVNTLGVKLSLAFGGLGYCLYTVSILFSSEEGGFYFFNVFAGALLGLCVALLWTAQGTIMVSYPKEQDKGKYFAYFWVIFNMGAVIGSL
ncbi:hypothetical protein EG329_010132, partial [Mollisiaceae sp. DMI_Dod_QoI]